MSRKYTDQAAKKEAKRIQQWEASHLNSFGFVDRDWDRIEDTEMEFTERLRTRGYF